MNSKKTKAAALALSGCFLLGAGNCLPEDFWADLYGNTLNEVAGTAVNTYVVGPLEDLILPDEE